MSVLSNTLSPAVLLTSSQCSQSVPVNCYSSSKRPSLTPSPPVNCYSSSKLPISVLSNTITTSRPPMSVLSNTITTSRQSYLTPSPPVGFLCQSSLTLYHQQSCQLPPNVHNQYQSIAIPAASFLYRPSLTPSPPVNCYSSSKLSSLTPSPPVVSPL